MLLPPAEPERRTLDIVVPGLPQVVHTMSPGHGLARPEAAMATLRAMNRRDNIDFGSLAPVPLGAGLVHRPASPGFSSPLVADQ